MRRRLTAARLPALLPALLAVLLTAACATVPVRTDYDEGTEFLFYTSFHVLPHGRGDRAVESLTEARVRQAIADALAAKGLAEAPEREADLLVRWRTRFHTRIIVADDWHRPFWARHATRVYRIREGDLVIELIDSRRHKVVWEGTAEGVVDDPERGHETVRRAVRAILDKYPPMHR